MVSPASRATPNINSFEISEFETCKSNLDLISIRIFNHYRTNPSNDPAKLESLKSDLTLFNDAIAAAKTAINQSTPRIFKIISLCSPDTEYSQELERIKEHQNFLKSLQKMIKKGGAAPSPIAQTNLKKALSDTNAAIVLLRSPEISEYSEFIHRTISSAKSLLALLKNTADEKTSKYKKLKRSLNRCSNLATLNQAKLSPSNQYLQTAAVTEYGGIPNKGNTCYLASSFQMMARFFPDLFEKELTLDQRIGNDGLSQAVESSKRLSQRKTFQEIAHPMVKLLRNHYNVNDIDTLARAIQVCKIVGPNSCAQECAMEAMGGMLDNLQAPRFTVEIKTAISSSNKRINKILKTGYVQQKEYIETASSNCDSSSMLRLQIINSLGIAKTIEETLDKTLRSSFSNYQYQNQRVRGVRLHKFDATSLPDTLPVVLNRFNDNRRKIKDKVKVGDTFTIPARHTKQGVDVKYTLKGFVIHNGSSNGGHYRAFFKEDDKWFHANDSIVKAADEDHRKYDQKYAYIYVFERIQDR